MTPSAQLVRLITNHSQAQVSPAVQVLIDQLKLRFSGSLRGILFYGSCLRDGEDLTGMFDLYVLVNNYTDAYDSIVTSIFNRLLPPNVYYLEQGLTEGVLRAKYAVISIQDFETATSKKWFHSYIWGRFTQPVQLVYALNGETRVQICKGLAQAALTFLTRVIPSLPERFTTSCLWQQGLSLSYGAELRAEKSNRPAQLFEANEVYFRELTKHAIPSLSMPITSLDHSEYKVSLSAYHRWLNRRAWMCRRIQGKFLSILRLIKAVFTFRGGVDYIAWKLERHTGVRIEVTEDIRRQPLLHGWGLVWRLYRQGVFR